MAKAWIRDLQVHLTSKTLKKKLTFVSNANRDSSKVDFDITVTGTKYMSFVKDSFVVEIKNLGYETVLQIINGRYYDIEILAGYIEKGAESIFKGGVIYASYRPEDPTTNSVILVCGNKLVATYGQNKMNMSIKKDTNMYSAIKFLCKRAGMPTTNIDEALKLRNFTQVTNATDTIGNSLQDIADTYSLIGNGDGTDNANMTIIDAARKNNRVIKLDKDNFVLTSGYPKVSSDGISFSTLPLFNFRPLDVVILDKSIIDKSVGSYDATQINAIDIQLDPDNKYLITQIDYSLSNRNTSYSVTIQAKARSLFRRFI